MSQSKIIESRATLAESVMAVTEHWAALRSKDPSTKVGACVYDHATGGMFLGYNGFPSGVPDAQELWDCKDQEQGITKYDLVVHAEVNAIRKALMAGADMRKCELFVTHMPCDRCMKDVIGPAGILRVNYRHDDYASKTKHSAMVATAIASWLRIEMRKV